MPVVHIYTAEGWLSPARKRLMTERVTDAIVAAAGFPPARDLTYVLVHDAPDGGWGFKGRQLRRADYAAIAPGEPATETV